MVRFGPLDPFALEVHRAITVAGSSGLPVLPPYLGREHDEELRGRVGRAVDEGRSAMVVLVGGSSTGKIRACWEALHAAAPAGNRPRPPDQNTLTIVRTRPGPIYLGLSDDPATADRPRPRADRPATLSPPPRIARRPRPARSCPRRPRRQPCETIITRFIPPWTSAAQHRRAIWGGNRMTDSGWLGLPRARRDPSRCGRPNPHRNRSAPGGAM